MKISHILSTGMSASSIFAAHGVEKPFTVSRGELPETVITAEKASLTSPPIQARREAIQQTPGGVEIIDSETYKRGRATTLKDALDFAPGVFVQPRFGAEEARLSIRGSGIQRTFHGRGLKLLQDGVPLNLADGGFDFQAIDPLTARLVEVYRGANALEFGSTTLGGAINFVTPTGYDAPRLTARAEYGSYESYRAQLAAAGVTGSLDYYVTFSHSSSDGFRKHSQQNTQRFFANFGYKLSEELETRFYLAYVHADSELPGNLTKLQLEMDPRQAQRNRVKIFDNVDSNWKRDFELFRIANNTTWDSGDHRLELSAFWSHKDLDHPILFVIDQLSNDFGVGVRYDNTGDLEGHKNRFTIGFTPTWGIVQDNRFANVLGRRGAKFADNEQSSINLDFYAQEQFWLTEKWSLAIGAQATYAERKNRDDFPIGPDNGDLQSWWGFSPKLGLLYQVTPDTQVFANVSRSFEPPSFGELTNAANNGRGLVQLDAQTGTTIEVGTRGRSGRFGWDLALYRSWLENELLEFQIAPGLTQTVNAEDTVHQGIELGFEFEIARGIFSHVAIAQAADGKAAVSPKPKAEDSITLRTAYLLNDFRYDGNRTFGDGLLAGIPKHYLRAELTYEHPCGFYAGPNLEFVPEGHRVDSAGTLFTDGYALLGAKIGWRTKRGVSFYVEGKNLTDERYVATTAVINRANAFNQAQFLPGDGRGFYGGIEFCW